ncbi:heat-inducible transcriptional repressor HrcA [Thiomicrorhabdus sp. zzn3]|uniref:heat-inducible transcriptional repressor HrcA n=1 Tax=Thiomicrorhabdus sp. zzn3 TaxID=3039775 RepID=UPI00243702E3|nr:heat-inducible transcriptional repressor HrcA [Thiomicrorhabdus sp. zzn3]MDG6778229.1 heat-inducible transcriptional repressor HrcA [Thiomicrorhabdus sp. zzn3]
MLNDRSQLLFKNLMGLYLNEGKPVGSTTLAKLPEIGLSSATIRNVLADLESMGLIASPHTSAGRVPTEKGYRLFVDAMLTYQPISKQTIANIQQQLSPNLNQDELLSHASKVLSGMTGLTSMVLMPNKERERLKHIDFIPLAEKRLLVVLVFNDQDVQNRIIELDTPVSSGELQQIANYLNKEFVGKPLAEAKRQLVERMQFIRQSMNELMLSVIEATDSVLGEQLEQKIPYLISGKTNLLNFQELANGDKLRALYQAFEQHSDVLKLLDKSMQARGVQIFIGGECGSELYQDFSVVTTPYEVDGDVLGVLGVIGPSRMHYERVVPKVDVTAKILSSILKK